MRECEAVRESLTGLLDGELPGDQREHVLAHLGRCPTCAEQHDRLQRGWRAMTLLPEIELPAALVVLPGLTAQVARAGRRPLALPRIAVAAALILSTALVIGFLLRDRNPAPHLVVVDDTMSASSDVLESIEDFSGLDHEWLAQR